MKKKFLTLIASVFFVFFGYSQNQLREQKIEDTLAVKHFAIELKMGIPNLAAGTAEVVLPLFKNLLFTNGDTNTTGTATTLLDLNTTHIKLGIKTAGTVYFRCEIGYGRGTVPDRLLFSARSNGITKLFDEALPPLPGLGSNGLLIGPSDLVFHSDFKKYKPHRDSLKLF
jgi:hypothetical protein